MSITSLSFVLFLFAALGVYYLLPRRPQNHWLLLVSYVFYVTWAWQFALVLLLLTLATFFLARHLRADGGGRRGLAARALVRPVGAGGGLGRVVLH